MFVCIYIFNMITEIRHRCGDTDCSARFHPHLCKFFYFTDSGSVDSVHFMISVYTLKVQRWIENYTFSISDNVRGILLTNYKKLSTFNLIFFISYWDIPKKKSKVSTEHKPLRRASLQKLSSCNLTQ